MDVVQRLSSALAEAPRISILLLALVSILVVTPLVVYCAYRIGRQWQRPHAPLFAALAMLEIAACLWAFWGSYRVGPGGRFAAVRYSKLSEAAWVFHAEDQGGSWSAIDMREIREARPARQEVGKRPWNADEELKRKGEQFRYPPRPNL